MTTPEMKTIDQQPKKYFPLGMIFILMYFAFAIVSSFIVFINPVLILGKFAITGISAILYQLISTTILVFCFIGIIKRKIWSKTLTIIAGIYYFCLGLFHFISFKLYPEEVLEIYNKNIPSVGVQDTESIINMTIIGGFFLSTIIYAIIIYYIVRQKQFFEN